MAGGRGKTPVASMRANGVVSVLTRGGLAGRVLGLDGLALGVSLRLVAGGIHANDGGCDALFELHDLEAGLLRMLMHGVNSSCGWWEDWTVGVPLLLAAAVLVGVALA